MAQAGNNERQALLVRLMWLSIAAAVATIALKTTAWALTGSVGLLSDAAESLVNFAAAVVGLSAVIWAGRPPDEEHAYGHEKANYLSAGFEGGLILLASATIAYAAVERMLSPREIEEAGIGLAVAGVAAVINLAVARTLISGGRRHDSLILIADGRHLMTDIWTSVGVIAAVGAVALTGWEILDPLIALVVALNILVTGIALVRRSGAGLMDRALRPGELARIKEIFAEFETAGTRFHALRTRRSGSRAFISVHVLVPGAWSVKRGHDLTEELERRLRDEFDQSTVFTHLEPIEDPVSFADQKLDRDMGV